MMPDDAGIVKRTLVEPSRNCLADHGGPSNGVATPSLCAFHLVVERLEKGAPRSPAPTGREPDTERAPDVLVVPAGVAHLRVDGDARPVLAAESEATARARIAFAPVRRARERALVMLIRDPNLSVRTNGCPSSRVAVLREGDDLLVSADLVMHVTEHLGERVAHAGAARAGRECPVCRVPLGATRIVFVCPTCDAALHVADGAAGDGLECATEGCDCPVCSTPISFASGYSYFPKL
jgi:hypothetical protein